MSREKLIDMIENECEIFRKCKQFDIKVFISNIKFFIKIYQKEKRNERKRSIRKRN